MNYLIFENIKYIILGSVIIYFVYDYIDNKRIKDEREEFLKLKTFEWMQKISLFSMTVLSIAYLLYPEMPAFVPLIILILSTMYTEIVAKIYFRQKY